MRTTTLYPTCTITGAGVEECVRKGCATPAPKTVIIPAKGHEWGDRVLTSIGLTCDIRPQYKEACRYCEQTRYITLDPVPHEWDRTIAIGKICRRCGLWDISKN